jgi:choline dehydrogenase
MIHSKDDHSAKSLAPGSSRPSVWPRTRRLVSAEALDPCYGLLMSGRREWDVVVVGGGAAGCVVAARLAGSGLPSVLLLEAGPDLRSNLPEELRKGWTIERELHDWGYQSEPHFGSPRPVRRKKLLGGTSWLTRFTPRGAPGDFNGWVASGNPGWGFEEVLPYFIRLETDLDFGSDPWHGKHGPMPSVRYLDQEHMPIVEVTVQALRAAGFPEAPDHNRPGAVGVGRMPMNTRAGIRVTTADAYLPVGGTPSNLSIRCNAQVDRVLFDGLSARGVKLLGGSEVEAGWVVLCAGTYGTPPILMRSGLGPPAHLLEVGIDVAVDLPGVGTNLADHPAVPIDFGYVGAGRSAPILHSIATFYSANRSSQETPDLMFWMADPSEADPSFGMEVVLLRPRSRGEVRLRSADPVEAPLIKLPDLSDPLDMERLEEGYRRAVDVANDRGVRGLCGGKTLEVPEDLEAVIRAVEYSVPHVVGTCAMGPTAEAGGVVDISGRVHGTERLSIVDASIVPDVPSGFVDVPVIMLAERLSERIASQM